MNQQGMQVDLSKATDLECKCGSKLFQPVMAIKTLSALISPTGQETMVPIQMYACIKCDEVPEKFKQEVSELG